jgi:outer membrane murein-binding lipoprotein Lpp
MRISISATKNNIIKKRKMVIKKVIILALILCGVCSVYAQETELIGRQTIKIDSLEKALQDMRQENDNLKSELSKMEKNQQSRKNMNDQLKSKTDSISVLESKLNEEKQKGEQIARDQYKKGKQEVLDTIIQSYKDKRFDELIKSSTKESVQRDLQLVGDNLDVKNILSDLDKYFNAKELLKEKYDDNKIQNAKKQLTLINQTSDLLLEKLKENIDKYDRFTKGLKEKMKTINELDKKESVYGMDEKIQKQKFDKISSYIFNYDFNLLDYPYLSEIVLEIIKRKYPDADADISDLLKRLE